MAGQKRRPGDLARHQVPEALPLTHEALDALPAGKPVEHLRSVLVATGTLPPRDEQMARLERWINSYHRRPRATRGERELVHRYAVWHLLRRLRRRTGGAETTYAQLVGVRRHVRAAISLLDWLAARDLTLATARQGDLDTWIASGEATGCREAGHFVRWATKHKLASLDFPATRWNGPASAIDTEARWSKPASYSTTTPSNPTTVPPACSSSSTPSGHQ